MIFQIKSHTSISGRALKALKRVIVLPLPGGPQSSIGLCSASQVYNSASCRTVSTVGTTMSGAATLWVSTSICGTLDCHSTHSPWIVTWRENRRKWSSLGKTSLYRAQWNSSKVKIEPILANGLSDMYMGGTGRSSRANVMCFACSEVLVCLFSFASPFLFPLSFLPSIPPSLPPFLPPTWLGTPSTHCFFTVLCWQVSGCLVCHGDLLAVEEIVTLLLCYL